jgi:hypothetical protein
LKLIERIKAQKTIDKISSGNFDELDVEMLFMRLRAYAGDHKVFREAADFVAHKDTRDRGLTNESIDSFYLSLKFFNDFLADGSQSLDIKGFPLYVKRLLRYQVKKCSEEDLKYKLKCSAQKLGSIVDNICKEDKVKNVCMIKEGVSQAKLDLIVYLLRFIKVEPVFSSDEFMNDLFEVLRKTEIQFNEHDLNAYRSKILISFCLLLHMAEFKLSDGSVAKCSLRSEREWVFQEFQEASDNFGKLSIFGECKIQTRGEELKTMYSVFDTVLPAVDFCSETLVKYEAQSRAPNLSGWRLDLNRPLQMIEGIIFAAE